MLNTKTRVIRIGGIYDKNGKKHQIGSIYDPDGMAPPLDTCGGGNREPMITEDVTMHDAEARIRKLTPKECWRLMGFDDEDFNEAQKEVSDTQLYRQAGNSIVVQVLMEIFKGML